MKNTKWTDKIKSTRFLIAMYSLTLAFVLALMGKLVSEFIWAIASVNALYTPFKTITDSLEHIKKVKEITKEAK